MIQKKGGLREKKHTISRGDCYFFEKNIRQKRIMHIKRCTRGQNMYIIASLKHALPPPPRVAYVLFKKITIAPWPYILFSAFVNVKFLQKLLLL